MKFIIIFLSLFFCNQILGQIDSIKALSHTVKYLNNNFSFDNTECERCYDCTKIRNQDSIPRLDSAEYFQSRLVGSCIALQKLQNLIAIDNKTQRYIEASENIIKLSEGQKTWIKQVNNLITEQMDQSMKTRGGYLLEQLDFATFEFENRFNQIVNSN